VARIPTERVRLLKKTLDGELGRVLGQMLVGSEALGRVRTYWVVVKEMRSYIMRRSSLERSSKRKGCVGPWAFDVGMFGDGVVLLGVILSPGVLDVSIVLIAMGDDGVKYGGEGLRAATSGFSLFLFTFPTPLSCDCIDNKMYLKYPQFDTSSACLV
jgi:hypothetical protein